MLLDNIFPVRVTNAVTAAKGQLMSQGDTDEWERLMIAALDGDGRAYADLLGRIAPVLRKVVRARAGSLGNETCEDVVQEILLAVHLKRQSWHRDAPLRPWLYAIARHKATDAFRRRGSRVHLDIDDFSEVLRAPEDNSAIDAHDIDRMIDRLDTRSARIVRAIGIEGQTYTELADNLQMTEGAVRVALHRALSRLASLRERMME